MVPWRLRCGATGDEASKSAEVLAGKLDRVVDLEEAVTELSAKLEEVKVARRDAWGA
jgi:hypothetical protein